MTNKKIGFIGLGRMGAGMARHLISKGRRLCVYDANPQALNQFAESCALGESAAQLARLCDILMLSLPDSAAVESVVQDFLKTDLNGKIIVDFSTGFPASSLKCHEWVRRAGGDFLEAPLAGTPVHAAAGTLTMMIGGDRPVFEKALPLLESLATHIYYVGGPGSGNIVKLASNYLSILYVALYGEIIPLLRNLGVDLDAFFSVVSHGGANSPVFQVVAPKIIREQYDVSFSLNLALKDLNYVKKIFEEDGAPSLMLDSGLKLFKTAEQMGLGNRDLSEVARAARNLFQIG